MGVGGEDITFNPIHTGISLYKYMETSIIFQGSIIFPWRFVA